LKKALLENPFIFFSLQLNRPPLLEILPSSKKQKKFIFMLKPLLPSIDVTKKHTKTLSQEELI